MSDERHLTGMEIAVIGMAGRFPGAPDVEAFWANLRAGVESITFLSRQELEAAGEAPEMLDSPNYVPVARLIEGEDLFDAQFFGSSPREAEIMDPQQRLFLECAWEALETAGYDAERYPGLIGVYAGAKMNSYIWNLYSNPRIVQAVGDFQAQISNEKDYVATRVAYKLGLGGPAVTVQSACSTSLVAIHLACQALLAGECDMALAGGISIRVPQRSGHVYREGEILSPDGHCRAFDAQAQGTIFGNGMGMVVLKRLEDALAEGDRIRAVIKGSAINNDGSVKVGYTAPGVDGQARVVRAAHLTAQVDPDSISCVEAHGTGTLLGDPIEVRALTQAFRAGTERRGFCALGSVKSNIGHLGAAAGVAGFLKTVLALENEAIPPSLLFERPNPQIDFDSSPFFVNTALREWPRDGAPRRAGVSAFGIGGTNAHIVVEEAPLPLPSQPASRPWQLLVLSAKTPTALEAVAARLRAHIERHPEVPLADIAYTLQAGRRPLEHRRALVCRDRDEALAALAEGAQAPGVPEVPNPPVAFLFSGQGAQYAGMGRDLYRSEAVFRDEIDRCAAVLQPLLGLDLRDLLYPPVGGEEEAGRRLGRTAVTQPALFTVEWALARLWMSWGIRPEAMIGHSIGEYVAACIAGVFSLEDALALVAERGRLMEGLPAGAMLSVSLPEEEVSALLGRQLALAAVNAPARCVVSGPEEAVAALETQLAARGIACRQLHTSHAFHSGMMEPILAPFVERVAAMALRPPQIPYISNVTGGWIREAEATDPEYWARHLRGTVRFGDGLEELFKERTRVMLEVGPGQNLATFCRQHPARGAARTIVSSLRHPREGQDDTAFLLRALGQLWLAGVAPDWTAFHAGEERRRVTLPTYPFERKRYWIAPGASPGAMGEEQAAQRRKTDVADFFHVPYWRPAPPPALSTAAGAWLIFADGCGLADALVARIRAGGAGGHRAEVVRPGPGFGRSGDGAWTIDPASREDYTALIAALRREGAMPAAVAHLWGVTEEDGPGASYDETQALGFYSLLWLAQALAPAADAGEVRVGVVTTGVQQVRGTEALTPEKATVLGPCKVAPQESPRLSTVAVDVVLPPASSFPSGLTGLAESLLAEIAAPAGERGERVVALRDGVRWVQSWDAVRLERAAAERLTLREQGVYLITGGLGGLGLVFAEYLARSWRARLVLVGRSALPPRQEWEGLAASLPADDAMGGKLRKLLELEASGAEVMAASADVADEAAVRAVVEQAVARFGAVHGVIHAAGVPGGGVIQLKTAEVAERVLAPKVRGTRALTAALAGTRLDFFLQCSSTIGVLGGFGQVDYCGANCFLDAWTHAASGRGEKALSVNWGAWDEVGMAVQTPLPRGARQQGREVKAPAPAVSALHPLLDECLSLDADRAAFVTRFEPGRHWVVAEHRIQGTGAVPGTGYLEMARAAFQHATGESAAEVRDVVFLSPVLVPDGESREVRTALEREGEAWSFRIESRGGETDGWQEHARGRVARLAAGSVPVQPIAAIQARCTLRDEEIAPGAMADVEKLVYWGPRWQSLRRIQVGEGEGLARLELPAEFAADLGDGLVLHPALLDVATALGGALAGGKESYLPLSYRRLRVLRPIPGRVWSHVRTREGGAGRETLTVDVTLLDDAGEPLVDIEQFSLKRVGAAVERFQRPAKSPNPPSNPLGAGGIRPAEGVEALRRLLSCPLGPQVAVSTRDFTALLRQAVVGAGAGETVAAAAVQEPMTRYPRPELKVAYAPPGDAMESLLVEVWQRVLGLEQVGIHDNFFELGGDSVMGIHVATRAAEAGLQVTPDQLFQYQTVAELAAAVRPVEAPAATPAATPAAAGGRFPLARLEPEVLQRILAEREVEDLYPLSPLQQGLLFHTLASPEAGLYLEQLTCTVDGPLEVTAMERAWQHAVDRQPALRTAFLWEDLERPLQVVSPRVVLPLRFEDWRDLSAAEQAGRFAEACRADRERPFPLSEAPLMRLFLYRLDDQVHRLTWTHHHLLMDGWSSPQLVHEVMTTYERIRRGEEPAGMPARPFRDYIEWLAERDLAASEAFWRRALAGFRRPTPVRGDRPGDGTPGLPGDYARVDLKLPADLVAALQEAARRARSTLNSVVQGLWALLLGRAAGERDVVFGTTVSSRPAAIPGIQAMIGLFINALPVRVRLTPEAPLCDWLRELQELQGALLEHAHTPLVDVQRWSEVPGALPLFETIYEFWNFPLSVPRERATLSLRDTRYDVATNYPLNLRVVPDDGLDLQLTYDRRRFDTASAERLVRALETALRAFLDLAGREDAATVGDLEALLTAGEREERQAKAAQVAEVALEKLRWRTRRRGVSGLRRSPQQERLWRSEEAESWRAWCVAEIEGSLDRRALEAAIAAAVERNELLRTLRWTLLEPDSERHRLRLELPALLSDAVGLDNLVGEIARCYSGKAGEEPVRYAELSEWQHELLESEETAEGREYWRRRPAPAETPELSLAQPVTAEPEPFAPRRLPVTLPDLDPVASAWGVPPGTVLLAGWQALLWHLTGRPASLALGVSFTGRRFKELREALGLFARDFPVEAALEPGTRLRDVAAHLHDTLTEMAEWQEYFVPAGDLPFTFEERPPARSHAAPGAVFRISRRDACHQRFLVRLVSDGGLVELQYDSSRLADLAAELLAERVATLFTGVLSDPDARLADLDLIGQRESRLLLHDWNGISLDLPEDPCLHRLVEEQAARTPEAPAVEFEDERWTYAELDSRASSLAARLQALGVAGETRVAICLDRSPLLVAAILGIWKAGGAYVPLDPSYPLERLALILEDARPALLLTGPGAPAGLAPGLPTLDLTDSTSREAVGGVVGPAQATGSVGGWEGGAHTKEPSRAEPPLQRPAGSAQPLAYVLYTSGSTGRPKGVMVSHRAIANRLLWMASAFPLTAADAVLQKTPFAFDASIWELFLPLLTGARLVMARPGGHQDPAYLTRAVERHGITILQLVPSLLGPFLDDDGIAACQGLRRLFCGGEALTPALRDRAFARLNADLCNLYGPTECAIDATAWPCRRDDRLPVVPIGRPIANDRVYLLDPHLRLVPAGVAGELYVAGAGLARGYQGRPDLTAERFLPDPFSPEPGGRLYRTGDLARHLPPDLGADGALEYLGRADDQVKVRGVRIELGEVESWLARHPAVAEVAAGVRDGGAGPEDRRLVAWVVPRGAAPSVAELRTFLMERLPEAMVPSAFVFLPALPRLGSGKIDRASLPAPAPGVEAGTVAPRTPTEQVLAALWAEVLGLERLGRHDNVFTLGWHSLLATRLVSRLRRAFGVDVPLRSLFEYPTVAALAERIDGLLRGAPGLVAPPIERVRSAGRDGALPLSFAQQRLWFLNRLAPGNPFYNVPVTLRLTGRLEPGALACAFSEVVRRHEVLRTTFPEVNEEPVQAVGAPAPVPLPLVDLSALPEGARQAEARRLDAAAALRPFDLVDRAKGPLLRVTLLRLAAEEHLVLLGMHHIVADGWSSQVLTLEVQEIYAAVLSGRRPELPALAIQYADYARWQREWLRGAALEAHVAYWRRQLDGAPPALELPTDRERPAVQSFRGATRSRLIPLEVAAAVRDLAAREGVTLFMVLLAAGQALLAWTAGQDDVVVGTDVAGRDRPETEGLIGFFINQVALRTRLGGDPTFRELLARVRETTLGAYAHQELPFDKLVEILNPERSLGRSPVFHVKINLLNVPPAALELPGLRIEPLPPVRGTAQFDWILNLAESEQGLLAWVEHATDLFDAATIDRMLGNFEAALSAVTARPELRLSELAEALEESDAAQRLAAQQERRQGLHDKLRKSRRPAVAVTAMAEEAQP